MASEIASVSFAEAKDAVTAAVNANVPILLWGSPGVGKTALMYLVAEEIKLPSHVVIGSACDPTDIGGFPIVKDDGSLIRIPMKSIRECIDKPGLLFLDELTCCPPAVQSTLLRVFLERVVGDFKLHEGTRIVAAANPPEQAPGATDVSAALAGRICQLKLIPAFDEVQKFFAELGKEGTNLRQEAGEFAMVVGVDPGLLEFDPPQASVTSGIPWGAPRNWERAIKCLAEVKDENTAYTVLAGSVGTAKAIAYNAIRKMRKDLPSVADVLNNPAGALVPNERTKQLAALGLVSRVCEKDAWASWIYAERLQPEIGAACARVLVTRKRPKTGKNAEGGEKAFKKLMSRIGREL